MVNNKKTGNEDIYSKPISPKPSIKLPPAPPPRANLPPKQKTLKFLDTDNSSEQNNYDNPIPYRSHNTGHESLPVHVLKTPPSYESFALKNNNNSGNIAKV